MEKEMTASILGKIKCNLRRYIKIYLLIYLHKPNLKQQKRLTLRHETYQVFRVIITFSLIFDEDKFYVREWKWPARLLAEQDFPICCWFLIEKNTFGNPMTKWKDWFLIQHDDTTPVHYMYIHVYVWVCFHTMIKVVRGGKKSVFENANVWFYMCRFTHWYRSWSFHYEATCRRLEGAKQMFKIFHSLPNLVVSSAMLLPMRLSNFKAM